MAERVVPATGVNVRIVQDPAPFGELTLIVPTLNEEGNLLPFLERAAAHVPGATVLFADDDSQDATREEAARWEGPLDVRILHRVTPLDRGLTASVADAILDARTEYVVVMDSDMQHPAEALPRLLDALREGHDVAVGTRDSDASFTPYRRVVSRTARGLSRAYLRRRRGLDVRDPMSGFFGVRTDVAQAIVKAHGHEFERHGFKVLLDLLLRGEGLRVAEVGYDFRPRHAGESKITRRHYLSFLRQLGRTGRFTAAFMELLLTGILFRFALVGASGVLVNSFVLFSLREAVGLPLMGATLIAIETSVLWNFAWNQSWTFRGRGGDRLAPLLTRFHVASLVGAIVHLGTVAGLHLVVPQAHYLLLNLVGIVLGSAANFLINLHWTWGVPIRRAKP